MGVGLGTWGLTLTEGGGNLPEPMGSSEGPQGGRWAPSEEVREGRLLCQPGQGSRGAGL